MSLIIQMIWLCIVSWGEDLSAAMKEKSEKFSDYLLPNIKVNDATSLHTSNLLDAYTNLLDKQLILQCAFEQRGCVCAHVCVVLTHG